MNITDVGHLTDDEHDEGDDKIEAQAGRENRIIEKLFLYKEVQEVHFVAGDFDIIAKICLERNLLSSDAEVIGQFIQNRVRSIPGVVKTQTLIPLSSKLKREPSIG